MKASEMIRILQEEMAKKGDVEVNLYGAYGGEGTEFTVSTDKLIEKHRRHEIWIYIGINTG